MEDLGSIAIARAWYMSTHQFNQDIKTVYLSEVYGEASFRSAYGLSRGRKKVRAKALLDLERQTKARVLAYYRRNRIRVPASSMMALKGRLLGLVFPLFPWRWVLKIILHETEGFLLLFQRLAEQADEQEKDFFQYLVDHEIAIRRFAELELQGRPDAALTAITDLLTDSP